MIEEMKVCEGDPMVRHGHTQIALYADRVVLRRPFFGVFLTLFSHLNDRALMDTKSIARSGR